MPTCFESMVLVLNKGYDTEVHCIHRIKQKKIIGTTCRNYEARTRILEDPGLVKGALQSHYQTILDCVSNEREEKRSNIQHVRPAGLSA